MSNINGPHDRSRDDLAGRDPLLNRESPRTFGRAGTNSAWIWGAVVVILILIGAYALWGRGGWHTAVTTGGPQTTTAANTTLTSIPPP